MLEIMISSDKWTTCIKGNTRKLLLKFMEHFLPEKTSFQVEVRKKQEKKAKIINITVSGHLKCNTRIKA